MQQQHEPEGRNTAEAAFLAAFRAMATQQSKRRLRKVRESRPRWLELANLYVLVHNKFLVQMNDASNSQPLHLHLLITLLLSNTRYNGTSDKPDPLI